MRTTATIIATALVVAAGPAVAMSLTSSDIADGASMPAAHIYTRCGGENVSPGLGWKGVPANAKSLALTVIDVSVKPSLWSHWIVVGLAPDSTGIARGAKTLPGAAHAVVSNFGDPFYDGPCPPDGSGLHRYQITLWALPRETLTIAPNANAGTLQLGLKQMAIDKASISVWVKR